MILVTNTYRPDEACSETIRFPSDRLDRSEGSVDSSEQYDERRRDTFLAGFQSFMARQINGGDETMDEKTNDEERSKMHHSLQTKHIRSF